MSDMGLSIAASGLAAALAKINTASNNLANATTPGYAAQKVNLSAQFAAGPLGVGQGVTILSVSQQTDPVYAAANVAAQGILGGATQANQIMGSIESIFPEPSATGIASQLATLWSDLSTLATNANQIGSQQAVIGAAQTLAQTISGSFSRLGQLSSSLQNQLGSGANDGGALAQVNSLLGQVAQLNVGIVAGTTGGQNVNALIGTRTAAVDQLAGLLGVTASAGAHGALSVHLNGVELVGGNIAQTLTATGSAASANLSIVTGNGVTVNARGLIGANVAAVNFVIPSYENQLNSVADSLATGINALQANGMNAKGDPGSAIAGAWAGTILPNIFVSGGSSGTYTTSSGGFNSAATIAVSPALLTDPSLIATASAPGPGNSNVIGTPTFDGTNAQAMAALASSATGPDINYRKMIGVLGTEATNASATSSAASKMATTAANSLSSISGVNQNAQEIDILAAQNAFQAMAKVVSAITITFQSLLAAV
ncbi:MAG TPA: flagellar hook-associated protein FlgK [Candidatus Paceibacterota bacterium]|nr:flagellar hook-associated protein FlgK [Candidatus Paceibacterota bacterium]